MGNFTILLLDLKILGGNCNWSVGKGFHIALFFFFFWNEAIEVDVGHCV